MDSERPDTPPGRTPSTGDMDTGDLPPRVTADIDLGALEGSGRVGLTPGARINQFTIVDRIGVGGMGEVYRARDETLHRDVALKFLPPALAADGITKARFFREAKLVASLEHPNIVSVHEFGMYGSLLYIAMPFIEGQELGELMRSGPIPVDTVLDLVHEIALALRKAHETGLVHRDIKPSNILVDTDGRPRIVDFGLSKQMTGSDLTSTGETLGTAAYMSPEQARAQATDARSDIFSLGTVFYEMLTGTHPFRRQNIPATLYAVTAIIPEPLHKTRPDLPSVLQEILDRLLAKEVADRYPSLDPFLADLQGARRALAGDSSSYRAAPLLPSVSADVLTTYREERINAWSHARYRLDTDFVGLTLLVDQGEESASGRWTAQTERYSDLGELLAGTTDPALVILGPPGSGKSSLLRRLELDVAREGLANEDEDRITFYIQLNRYKDLHPGGPPPDPETWLGERWAKRFPEMPALGRLLSEGRVILLLDGLNEIPTTEAMDLRSAVIRWKDFLDRFFLEHPGNRVVFTCRTLDYSAPLSTQSLRVPQIVIAQLTDAQVEQFLLKHDPREGARLWSSLRGTPQLEVMRSPYFLSLLVEQGGGSGVSRGRAELFTGFVRQALRREAERDHPLFAPGALLTDRDVRQITHWRWRSHAELPERGQLIPRLSALAFGMQARSGGGGASQVRVDMDTAIDLLDHPEYEDMIRAGIALSLLDEDPANDELLFFHQLIQEYFAGRELARRPDPDRLRTAWRAEDLRPALASVVPTLPAGDTLPALATTGWEETARFAAAMAQDPDAFVRGLMEAQLPLAGECAALPEVRDRLAAETVDRVRTALVERSGHPQADLRARIAAGLALGMLGDPRFAPHAGPDGTCLIPPTVALPGGRYPVGEDAEFDYLGHSVRAHTPAHTVQLPTFRMAVFPVTNAEWSRFMAADGYNDPRWWDTEASRRWQSGEGTAVGARANSRYWWERFRSDPAHLETARMQGVLTEEFYDRWRERVGMTSEELDAHLAEVYPGGELREPMMWRDAAFNNPAQPVVGVSWFEARAYALWLSAQTGHVYRLPTEVEWEAAARGMEGRAYAWGDTFRSLAGNTSATRLQRPSPVGVFVEGTTPEGVADLTGNVGEWTSSAFGEGVAFETAPYAYPYRADDGRESIDVEPTVRRVLRGGTWNDGEVLTRAVYRNDAHPDNRKYVVGVRLVRDEG